MTPRLKLKLESHIRPRSKRWHSKVLQNYNF